jgi:signal transduction histidine kinase
MLGGVCAGLGERFGVPPVLFRLLVALFVAAGGVGVVLYGLAWALIPAAQGSAAAARRPGAVRDAVVIVVAIAVALALLRASARVLGIAPLGSVYEVAWPLALGACGIAIVWRLSVPLDTAGSARRPSLRAYLGGPGPIDIPRIALGLILFTFAAASLLHTFGVQHSLGKAIFAVAIVAALLALLVGPGVVRMGRTLALERSARIREQERAEVAAHLHDSVLQTLALIQKHAGEPREVAALARQQERELRSWLVDGRQPGSGPDTLAGALARAAAEVEQRHGVPIEVVTVGDGALEPALEPIVQAAREAMTNAAKFSGAEVIDLYAEAQSERVEVFVRDRGVGFDIGAVPSDRRGVRDSIIGRLERHRGHARVTSTPGRGTEVELSMERAKP